MVVKNRRKKIIKIKRKNPSESDRKKVEKILSNASFWEYFSEGWRANTYYFVLKNKFKIKDITIPPGQYILKSDKNARTYSEIDRLKSLSDLDLIPKIYYIDKYIIVMKYISGKELSTFYKKSIGYRDKMKILRNILEKFKKWHENEVYHGDLYGRNILVDKNLDVYFIDPWPSSSFYTDQEAILNISSKLVGDDIIANRELERMVDW